jgi:hypothetical protein
MKKFPRFPRHVQNFEERRKENHGYGRSGGKAPTRPKPDPNETTFGTYFQQGLQDKLPHREFPKTGPLYDAKLALDEIYKWILAEVGKKLEAINEGTFQYHNSRPKNKTSYNQAVKAFEEFVDALDNPHPWNPTGPNPKAKDSFGPTIKWVKIDPKLSGGYIVGANVAVRWLGGTHSDSSTIHVP